MLSPLPTRNSSSRETYVSLRAAILSGTLQPGARLYEGRIADELGVSRTPVREALAMLEAEELVVSVPNRGTVVRGVTADEVREAYDVRVVLEAHAAHLAAGRIAKSELQRLRRIDREMNRLIEARRGSADERVRRLTELNSDFHRTIAGSSGNRVLARVIGTLIDTPLSVRAFYWYTREGKADSVGYHDRMLELLERGNPEECEAHWREHLFRGRDAMLAYLNDGRDGGDDV